MSSRFFLLFASAFLSVWSPIPVAALTLDDYQQQFIQVQQQLSSVHAEVAKLQRMEEEVMQTGVLARAGKFWSSQLESLSLKDASSEEFRKHIAETESHMVQAIGSSVPQLYLPDSWSVLGTTMEAVTSEMKMKIDAMRAADPQINLIRNLLPDLWQNAANQFGVKVLPVRSEDLQPRGLQVLHDFLDAHGKPNRWNAPDLNKQSEAAWVRMNVVPGMPGADSGSGNASGSNPAPGGVLQSQFLEWPAIGMDFSSITRHQNDTGGYPILGHSPTVYYRARDFAVIEADLKDGRQVVGPRSQPTMTIGELEEVGLFSQHVVPWWGGLTILPRCTFISSFLLVNKSYFRTIFLAQCHTFLHDIFFDTGHRPTVLFYTRAPHSTDTVPMLCGARVLCDRSHHNPENTTSDVTNSRSCAFPFRQLFSIDFR